MCRAHGRGHPGMSLIVAMSARSRLLCLFVVMMLDWISASSAKVVAILVPWGCWSARLLAELLWSWGGWVIGPDVSQHSRRRRRSIAKTPHTRRGQAALHALHYFFRMAGVVCWWPDRSDRAPLRHKTNVKRPNIARARSRHQGTAIEIVQGYGRGRGCPDHRAGALSHGSRRSCSRSASSHLPQRKNNHVI